MLVAFTAAATAQVASHAPTTAMASATPPAISPLQISDKPVARVNGAVLTDRDLVREMYAIFPYAKQHNGFPKSQEAAIRQGALVMIIRQRKLQGSWDLLPDGGGLVKSKEQK